MLVKSGSHKSNRGLLEMVVIMSCIYVVPSQCFGVGLVTLCKVQSGNFLRQNVVLFLVDLTILTPLKNVNMSECYNVNSRRVVGYIYINL